VATSEGWWGAWDAVMEEGAGILRIPP
jgi:hypothetical protein